MSKKIIKEEVVVTTKEIKGDSEKIISVEKQTIIEKEASTKEDSVKEDSVKEDSVKEDSTKKEPMKEATYEEQVVSNKKARKEKKNPARVLVPLGIIFAIIIVSILGIFQLIERHKIKKDIENRIAYIEMGDLSWTTLSRVDISDELNQYMSGRVSTSEDDMVSLLVKSNDISYKIGPVLFGKAKVQINNATYSFDDYILYCDGKGITTKEEMIDSFDSFASSHDKEYICETSVSYTKKHGRWICDYNDVNFINHMSGGMVEAYAEYYDKSIVSIQTFIESQNEEEAKGEE